MSDGHKTALELALDAWREQRQEAEAAQGELFDLAQVNQALAPRSRGPGRPPGSRNRRTDEAARLYIVRNEGRDPLERGIEIAGLPVLKPGILEGLAERFDCTRFEAMKLWVSVLNTTLPFTHQRLSQLEVKGEGEPGGPPVTWTFSHDGQGEILDVTPDPGELKPQEP